MEAEEERTERRSLCGGRTAPDRRGERARPGGHLLPHALHVLADRAEGEDRGSKLVRGQRQGPGPVAGSHNSRSLQLPPQRQTCPTGAPHTGETRVYVLLLTQVEHCP